MMRRLKSALRPYDLFAPEDDERGRILLALLLGLLLWTILEIAVGVPFFAARKVPSLICFGAQALILIVGLDRVRRGSVRQGAQIYLIGFWLLSTIVILVSGGLHSPVVAIYVTVPISAAWLFDYRAMLRVSAMFLISPLLMALLQIRGIGPWYYFPIPPIAAWVLIVEAALIGALPAAQVLKILRERLAQSEADRTALRESEERFRTMADTAPVMIWMSGTDKRTFFFNKGWLEFRGRTMEQEVSDGWTEGVHPDDLERRAGIYGWSFAARQAFEVEFRLRRRDGEYRWLLDRGITRLDPHGLFMGYIGSSLDITDIKLAFEADLTRHKMETVGTLAGGIAHDFNNLLSGVLAQSELALEGVGSGDNPTEGLRYIRDAAVRGAEIVRQLMVYAGKEAELDEFVDVSETVEDILGLLKVSLSKHVAVETDLRRPIMPVRASPSQIRQIVMNLFINASEAIGDRKGVLRVITSQLTVVADSGLVAAGRLESGDYVTIEISDNGPGMTAEVQSRVFEAFFTTKTTGGHGLGLATVQGIVERLRGTILLSSKPEHGATFQIYLPCASHVNPD